jgi:hypothetical protein
MSGLRLVSVSPELALESAGEAWGSPRELEPVASGTELELQRAALTRAWPLELEWAESASVWKVALLWVLDSAESVSALKVVWR